MKISLLLVAITFATQMYANPSSGYSISFTPIGKDTPDGGNPRSPVALPEFYLDGYTLTAGSYTIGSTIELLDSDGDVVFTSYIYVEGDTIVLPSSLSGTYTIRVTRGSQTFVGEIEL